MGDLIALSPEWQVIPLSEKTPLFPENTANILITGGTAEQRGHLLGIYPHAQTIQIDADDTVEQLKIKFEVCASIDHIIFVPLDQPIQTLADEALIQNQKQGVLLVFRMIKALFSIGYQSKELGWTLITTQTQAIQDRDSINPTHASIHGLAGSLANEYPHWKIRLLDLESGCDWPLQEMFRTPTRIPGNALVYQGEEWFEQTLVPVRQWFGDQTLYRRNGLYVVIGGAGGIGEIWSKFMIEKYQVQIIWLGRKKMGVEIQAQLDVLQCLGPVPIYIQADATEQQSLQRAYEEIKRKYPQIHGVIHSASNLAEQSLDELDEQHFKSGLTSKVDISIRLAQVFEKEPLDFVLFFSSLMAFEKSAGQSNVAAGCAFKDAFAHRMSQDWPCAVKIMNWGYWGSTGAAADSSSREKQKKADIGCLEPEEGMESLEMLMHGAMNQVALLRTI